MENIHPNSEQLSHYMESPESSAHKDLRIHLMACENCRSRVDKLTQLELDIKHYVPRLAPSIIVPEDKEHTIAHYIDGNPDVAKDNNIQQQILQDSDKLKSALHYAVHSAAMSKNSVNASRLAAYGIGTSLPVQLITGASR